MVMSLQKRIRHEHKVIAIAEEMIRKNRRVKRQQRYIAEAKRMLVVLELVASLPPLPGIQSSSPGDSSL